jgi:hypothetical protein
MVLGSHARLSLAQLREALAVNDPSASEYCHDDIDESLTADQVRKVTRNLLVSTFESGGHEILEFAHMSVVDFFMKHDEPYSQLDCQCMLLQHCLFFLRQAEKEKSSCSMETDHFNGAESLCRPLSALDLTGTGDSDWPRSTSPWDSEKPTVGLRRTPNVANLKVVNSFLPYADCFWTAHCGAALILSEEEDELVNHVAIDVLGNAAWAAPLDFWEAEWKARGRAWRAHGHHPHQFHDRVIAYATAGSVGWYISTMYGLPKLAEKLALQTRYRGSEAVNARGRAGPSPVGALYVVTAAHGW